MVGPKLNTKWRVLLAWDLGVWMDIRLKASELLQLHELLPIRCFTLEGVWVKNTFTVFCCISDDG